MSWLNIDLAKHTTLGSGPDPAPTTLRKRTSALPEVAHSYDETIGGENSFLADCLHITGALPHPLSADGQTCEGTIRDWIFDSDRNYPCMSPSGSSKFRELLYRSPRRPPMAGTKPKTATTNLHMLVVTEAHSPLLVVGLALAMIQSR
jgi:hypothetical protein